MSGNLAKKVALTSSALAWMVTASAALATEPKPAPKSDSQAAPPAAAQAKEQVTPAPAAENQPLTKPMPQPKRPQALDAKEPTPPAEPKPIESKTNKSLVAPPGLLSKSPQVVPFSPPGLGKLNLNAHATTIEQIQRLPGVGVVWAPRILAGRPYRTFGEMARDGVPFTTIDALSREVELGP